MNNLGYKTDCLLHHRLGEVERRPRYWVVRNPNNPTYYWGNLLIYPKAPRVGEAKEWLLDFKEEFGQDSGHVTLGWDEDSIGTLESFRKWGFRYEPVTVMELENVSPIEQPPICDRDWIRFREIESEEDWRKLVELHVQVYEEAGQESTHGYRVFAIRKYRDYRKLVEAGMGFWMGAFDGDDLVADMGLFWDLEQRLARFQSVETAATHRRKGICSALIQYVLRVSFGLCGLKKWVIVAEVGGGAERLYLRQGFRKIGVQHGICCPRPFAYESFV